MRSLLVVFVVSSGLLVCGCGGAEKKTDTSGGGACACGTATPAKEGATCTCAEVKGSKKGWCDHCGAGMVEGQKSTCAPCCRAGKMCDACARNGGAPCPDCAAKKG